MATSSAVPENLQSFVSQAGAATDEVKGDLGTASSALNAFLDAPNSSGYTLPGGAGVLRAVGSYVSDAETVEKTVATIRQAFLNADATTLTDSAIDRALSVAGLSNTPPPAVTYDEPVYKGPALESGWSDDPVSTATGHFLEVESDLVMPEGLSVLAWTRTYSSRWLVEGALGRGWATWADVRLDVAELSVTYRGPDGQTAELDRVGDGFGRCRGLEADLVATESGFELRWWWAARFPGVVMVFDRSGVLVEIRNPFGGVTSAERDGGGRLVGLAHEGGRRLDLVWEGDRIVRVEASDGRTVTYSYLDGTGSHVDETGTYLEGTGSYVDETGDLVGVERPSGARRYTVDLFGRIVEVFDADGVREVANTYDSVGRVLSQTSPFGRVTQYTYLAPNTVAVGDAAGEARTLYRHDPSGRLLQLVTGSGRSTRRVFDDAGNVVEIVDLGGGVTTREFDEAGNCVSETTPDGATVRWSYDESRRVVSKVTPGGAMFELTYPDDSAALPARISGPDGWFLEIESVHGQPVRILDADGVSVSYERDADGSVLSVTDGEGNVTRYDRHPSGAYTRIVAPTGESVSIDVDDAGRALSAVLPGGGQAALAWSGAGRPREARSAGGGVTTATWGAHGALAGVLDTAGATTSFTYDQLGQLTGVELPNGAHLSYAYDRMGNLTEMLDASGARWIESWTPAGAPASVTDPTGGEARVESDPVGRPVGLVGADGRRVEFDRDADGRVANATDEHGGSLAVRRDAVGRVVEALVEGRLVAAYTYTPGGRVATMRLGDGSRWSYRYDRAGRIVGVDGPDGARTTWVLDGSGRPVAYTDPAGLERSLVWGADGRVSSIVEDGRVTGFVWDADGRLVAMVGPDGARLAVSYDSGGRVRTVEDAEGGVTEIERNVLGEPVSVETPDGARWGWEHDLVGRATGVVDPLGRRVGLAHDKAGRLARLVEPSGRVQTWDWDAGGRLRGISLAGETLLAVELDDSARSSRTTDFLGRVSELTWDRLGRSLFTSDGRNLVRYGYDDVAGTATVSVGDGRGVVYRQDRRGRVVAVSHPALGDISLSYDAAGRLVRLAGQGLQRRWTHDRRGRVVSYRESIGDRTRSFSLERDAVGRVVTEREHDGDGEKVRRYRYDRAGQLLVASGPEGSWEWSYDACGRMVSELGPDGSRSFAYDLAGQLVEEIATDGARVGYQYDPMGRRIGEDRPGLTVEYHWDALGRLSGITRRGAQGVSATRLEIGPLGDLRGVDGTPVVWSTDRFFGQLPLSIGEDTLVGLPGQAIATVGADGPAWVSVDWRGSTVAAEGTDPWGHRPVAEAGGVGPRLGFLGEVELGGGLVWLRNRVYDPATHAFLSRDPLSGSLSQPGGWANPYQYAENDPVGKLDPSGLKAVTAAQAAQQMQGWKQGHWGEVASALLAAGAVALIVTGVGAPIGAGILIGEGMSIGSQELFTGHVNFDQVALSGALGGIGGGVAAGVAGLGAVGAAADTVGGLAPDALAPAVSSAVSNGIGGAAGGLASGAAGQAISGHFSPTGLVEDTAMGFGGGAVIGGLTGGVARTPEPAPPIRTVSIDTDAIVKFRLPAVQNVLQPGDRLVATPNVVSELQNSVGIKNIGSFLGARGITPVPAEPGASIPASFLRQQLDGIIPGARGNPGDALNIAEAGSIKADLFVTADANTIGRTFGHSGSIFLPATGGLSLPFVVV